MERTMETNVEQQYKLFNLIWNAISLWLKYCNFTNDLKELKLLFLWSKVITKAFLDFFFFFFLQMMTKFSSRQWPTTEVVDANISIDKK